MCTSYAKRVALAETLLFSVSQPIYGAEQPITVFIMADDGGLPHEKPVVLSHLQDHCTRRISWTSELN